MKTTRTGAPREGFFSCAPGLVDHDGAGVPGRDRRHHVLHLDRRLLQRKAGTAAGTSTYYIDARRGPPLHARRANACAPGPKRAPTTSASTRLSPRHFSLSLSLSLAKFSNETPSSVFQKEGAASERSTTVREKEGAASERSTTVRDSVLLKKIIESEKIA